MEEEDWVAEDVEEVEEAVEEEVEEAVEEEEVEEDVGGREEGGLSQRWNFCHEERIICPCRYSLSSARRNVADPIAAQMGRMFLERDLARSRMCAKIFIRS